MTATARKERVRALARAPDDQPPPSRLEWWKAPVEGWREGWIEIRNIMSGETHVIRLSDGEVIFHRRASPPISERSEEATTLPETNSINLETLS